MLVWSDMSLLGRRVAARLIDFWLLGFLVLALWVFGFVGLLGDCAAEDPSCGPGGLLGGVMLALAYGAV